jgi:hypothetical protein
MPRTGVSFVLEVEATLRLFKMLSIRLDWTMEMVFLSLSLAMQMSKQSFTDP